jgi:hypothetical protein
MKAKQKPCKDCGEVTYFLKYDRCDKCRPNWLLLTPEGQKKIELKKREAEKQTKRKHRAEKEKVKDWKPELQSKVNEIARLIDYGLPCLATLRYGKMHGGHVYSRGSSPNIKFNLHNIHRQKAQSNHFQADDGLMREGLISEYGQSYLDWLNVIRQQTPPTKLSNEDYHELTKKAGRLIRLYGEPRVNTPAERVELRNEFNDKLGIYTERFSFYRNKCKFNESGFLKNLKP